LVTAKGNESPSKRVAFKPNQDESGVNLPGIASPAIMPRTASQQLIEQEHTAKINTIDVNVSSQPTLEVNEGVRLQKAHRDLQANGVDNALVKLNLDRMRLKIHR